VSAFGVKQTWLFAARPKESGSSKMSRSKNKVAHGWATSAAQIINGGTVGDPALAGIQNLMFATIALDTNSDAAV
jgi:hypothetical protein